MSDNESQPSNRGSTPSSTLPEQAVSAPQPLQPPQPPNFSVASESQQSLQGHHFNQPTAQEQEDEPPAVVEIPAPSPSTSEQKDDASPTPSVSCDQSPPPSVRDQRSCVKTIMEEEDGVLNKLKENPILRRVTSVLLRKFAEAMDEADQPSVGAPRTVFMTNEEQSTSLERGNGATTNQGSGNQLPSAAGLNASSSNTSARPSSYVSPNHPGPADDPNRVETNAQFTPPQVPPQVTGGGGGGGGGSSSSSSSSSSSTNSSPTDTDSEDDTDSSESSALSSRSSRRKQRRRDHRRNLRRNKSNLTFRQRAEEREKERKRRRRRRRKERKRREAESRAPLSPLEALVQAGKPLKPTSKVYGILRKQATAPWETEDRFSLNPDGNLTFQSNLDMRLTTIGINSGPTSAVHFKNEDGEPVNIIFACHTVSEESLIAQTREFIVGERKGEIIAQTADLLFHVVWNGLTSSAQQRLSAYRSKFVQTFVDEKGRTRDFHNGPLLFKTISNIVEFDTKATIRSIKQEIQHLRIRASRRFSNDPEKLIEHFQSLRRRLHSFGTTMEEEELYLIKALEDFRGEEFQRRVKIMSDAYDDDAPDCVKSADQVIARAIRWKRQIASKGEWWSLKGSRDATQGTPIALDATVEDDTKLQGGFKFADKGRQSFSFRPKPLHNKPFFKHKSSQQGPSKPVQILTKNKKPTNDRRYQRVQEAWMRTPPKGGQPETKEFNGRTWHWCHHHMAWTNHRPEDCRLGKNMKADRERQKRSRQGGDSNATTNKYTNQSMSFRAHAASIRGPLASIAEGFARDE